MSRNRPTRRPYRLPIAIVKGGIEHHAGAQVDLFPRQIVQVEEAARAAGVLLIPTDLSHDAPEEGGHQ